MSDSTAVMAGTPAPAPPAKMPPRAKTAQVEHKDGSREIVETVVFVVVLVLLLKPFLAEAFIIPTGSMATTLLGYHKNRVCEKCGSPFRVNASNDDPSDDTPVPPRSGICPNCRYVNNFPAEKKDAP